MHVTEWDYRISDILDAVVHFCNETGYTAEYSSGKALADIWKVYNAPNTAIFCNYRNDKLAAVAFCQLDDLFMVNTFGYIVKFYVMPEARGTTAARELMQEITDWFDEQGVTDSFSTATANIGLNKHYVNLLRKFGYTECGVALHRKNTHV